MPDEDTDRYNGPDRASALDATADYEEQRFAVMKATSKCGAILRSWERKGGNADDIRDLYALRKMTPEEQQAEMRRNTRVFGWAGIVTVDEEGQSSFIARFDPPVTDGSGIGNAPLGSRLSIVRAKSAGFNDGKAKGVGTMQDGLKVYLQTLGWEVEGPEAHSYIEGYDDGLELRPPAKLKKTDEPAPIDMTAVVETAETEPPPAKTRRKSTKADVPVETAEGKPGWQADRDFHEDRPLRGETIQ